MTNFLLGGFALISFAVFAGAVCAQGQGTRGQTSGGDQNLEVAIAQLAGMFVCDRMRGKFRPLKSEGADNQEATSGTLWVRECSATANGKELSLSLGGQGWRWVFRQKERAGAQFEVSQYATFAVEVDVTGEVDASYDPQAQVFTLSFIPSYQPQVSFEPIGNVNVDEQGLWSSVVSGVASIVMESPEQQASQQLQSMGRKRFQDRFAQGYTAKLDFCSGRLRTGFGLDEQATQEAAGKWTAGFMHSDGLIIAGPEDVDPDRFSVTVSTQEPMQAQLMCSRQADQLARAFIEDRELPQVNTLASQVVQGEQTLQLDQQVVNCPVALVFRPSEQTADAAFQFRYRKETAPLIPQEQTQAQCPGGASAN